MRKALVGHIRADKRRQRRGMVDASRRREMAAKRLQRCWRQCWRFRTTPRLVRAALCHVEPADGIYEQLMQTLRDPVVHRDTKALLTRIMLRYAVGGGRAILLKSVRIYLVSYPILRFPLRVFSPYATAPVESLDALPSYAQALREVAIALRAKLAALFALGGRLPRNHDQVFDLEDSLELYWLKYSDWQKQSRLDMLNRCYSALRTLYGVREYLTADDVNSNTRADYYREVARLESLVRTNDGVLPPPPAANSSEEAAEAPPPQTVEMASQKSLAYAVMVDPTFQLKDHPSAEDNGAGDISDDFILTARIQYTESFWATLTREMTQRPPVCTTMLRAVGEIRKGLLGTFDAIERLSPQERAGLERVIEEQTAQIEAIFDMDHIRRQIELGAFSMASTMSLLEAAFKLMLPRMRAAEEPEKRWRLLLESSEDEDKLIKATRFLFTCIDKRNMDLNNQRLRYIAPTLQTHGISYFQGKFAEDHAGGSLAATKQWLLDQRRELLTEQDDDIPLAVLHAHAFTSFLLSATPLRRGEMPETLELEWTHLENARLELISLVQCRLALIVANRSPATTENKKVVASIISAIKERQPVVATELGLSAKDAAELQGLLAPTSPAYILLVRRLRAATIQRPTATVAFFPMPASVSPENADALRLAKRYEAFVARVQTIARYNFLIHADRYAALLSPSVA